MSSSTNPIYPQTPVFIPSFWEDGTETGLTQAAADKRYLKYPIGQSGTQTLSGLIVNNISSIFNTSRLYITRDDISSNTILNDSGASVGTGWFNSFFGRNCGKNITTGGTNCGYGEFENLSELTSGSSNSAYGNGALQNVKTSSFNTAIGNNAGYTCDASYNTFLGANADAAFSTISNSTAVGFGSTVFQSNQIVLGRETERVYIPNQLVFNYTSNPTYANTALGYNLRYNWTSILTVTGAGVTVASFTNLPIGLYLFQTAFLNYGIDASTRNDFQLTTQTNVTNLTCSNTLEYGGNVIGKLCVTPCFLLQVTGLGTILYKFTNIAGTPGTVQIGASTLVRIA